MDLRFLKQKAPLLILAILIIVVLGISAYYFLVYQKNKTSNQDPTQAAIIESKNLVEKLGKFIELPNEQPQIATVSDVSKLSNQPFFQKAQNGDKVLIYNLAKKAILYRPSTNKIIDVAALVVPQPTTEPAAATPSARVTPSVSPTSAQNVPTFTPTP